MCEFASLANRCENGKVLSNGKAVLPSNRLAGLRHHPLINVPQTNQIRMLR